MAPKQSIPPIRLWTNGPEVHSVVFMGEHRNVSNRIDVCVAASGAELSYQLGGSNSKNTTVRSHEHVQFRVLFPHCCIQHIRCCLDPFQWIAHQVRGCWHKCFREVCRKHSNRNKTWRNVPPILLICHLASELQSEELAWDIVFGTSSKECWCRYRYCRWWNVGYDYESGDDVESSARQLEHVRGQTVNLRGGDE